MFEEQGIDCMFEYARYGARSHSFMRDSYKSLTASHSIVCCQTGWYR
jgi:hypothetical protein